jgi:uncharacterized protein YjlB
METKVEETVVKHFYVRDNGRFPNSSLPVIFYKSVLHVSSLFPARDIIKLFASNNWKNSWKDGVYTYHHYHSNSHEVLGFYKGSTTLRLGGDDGVEIVVGKGDVLIIPAGVAHQNLQNETDVSCVGAYTDGISYDIKLGISGERPQTDENIAKVELPICDPVFGQLGELHSLWKSNLV